MPSFRYANIGAGVAFVFILLGVFLVRDVGRGAVQAIGLVGFVLGMVVMAVLEERNRRSQERDQ